ncbi:hypothetical protein C6503_03515 [Candidatus Poribacteria bacterium]|nr:MAG: hypothetical protein C6503_03515 [Candidatus Poribacteria bacterium]
MNKFRWHLLAAFLTLIVTEIFNDGFQPIALIVGSVILAVFLYICESVVNGVFNRLKRIGAKRRKC